MEQAVITVLLMILILMQPNMYSSANYEDVTLTYGTKGDIIGPEDNPCRWTIEFADKIVILNMVCWWKKDKYREK